MNLQPASTFGIIIGDNFNNRNFESTHGERLEQYFNVTDENGLINGVIEKFDIRLIEDEYNVSIEDYPSGINTIYSKFNSLRSNVEEYVLSFFDDYESEEIMIEALTKSGYNINTYEILAMDVNLFQKDFDDTFDLVTSNIDMTVICEAPMGFKNSENKIKIFTITDNEGLENIPYSLVEVGDIICMKFNLKRSTYYAFVLSYADI